MPNIKLDKEDVIQIKLLFETTQLTDTEIAKIYDVSRKHINSMRHGKRWSAKYGREREEIQRDLDGYLQR